MTDTEPTIPKSRFDDRVRQARETEEALREQIAKLTDTNKSLTKQAGKAESLAQQVAKLESDLTAAGQNHGRQMAATRAGITDPEDVADVLAIYNRRAPEGVAFSDWLGSDDLPRSVRSMMPTAEPATTAEPTATEPATATAEPTATPSRLPRPNNGVILPIDPWTDEPIGHLRRGIRCRSVSSHARVDGATRHQSTHQPSPPSLTAGHRAGMMASAPS